MTPENRCVVVADFNNTVNTVPAFFKAILVVMTTRCGETQSILLISTLRKDKMKQQNLGERLRLPIQYKVKERVPRNGLTLADVVCFCIVKAGFSIDDTIYDQLPPNYQAWFEEKGTNETTKSR
jgi:hypothetical protein